MYEDCQAEATRLNVTPDELMVAELEDIRSTIAVVLRCGNFPADGHLSSLRAEEAAAVAKLAEIRGGR